MTVRVLAMRIVIAALASLVATPALAQDTPTLLQKAERDRDAIMAEANAAIATMDWPAACEKAKLATDQQFYIATPAGDWLDEIEDDNSIDDTDCEILNLRVIQAWQMHTGLITETSAICAKAEE